MRFRIILSYNGSAFCGWQIQKNAVSVQGTLEDALGMLLGCPVQVTGAGRTDSGVNARNYTAHFDHSGVFSCDELCRRLNAILPREIAVHSICKVSDDFHARFSAVSRQYQYFIHQEKDPFKDSFSWYCRYKMDIGKMNEACKLLLGTHDCSCFEKKGSDNATSICNISDARWELVYGDDGNSPTLRFTVEANRFLRNMVRAIVGTMIDIGRGVHEPSYINELFENGNRGDAGQSVPGHALFLTAVRYPETDNLAE